MEVGGQTFTTKGTKKTRMARIAVANWAEDSHHESTVAEASAVA
jgi:hypothetical protein